MMDEINNGSLTREEMIEQKSRELEENFTYEGYQVVRKELFAHLRDPAVVIRRDSITFNTACINGLEDTVYINIMINVPARKMVVCKCSENDKDALRWCVAKPDKRKCRKMSCKIFTAKLYRDMNWNIDCRYKVLGYRITAEDQTIYIFDLSETEVFLDTGRKKTAQPETNSNQQQEEQVVRQKQRKGYLPEEWEGSYGMPVEEHSKALDVNMREGYVQFSAFPDQA